MRPTQRLLWLLTGWTAVAVLAVLVPALLPGWEACGVAIGLLALVDALLARRSPALRIERDCPRSLAQGVWHDVVLQLRNDGRRIVRAEVFDGVPASAECEGLPRRIELWPGTQTDLRYRLRSRQRGDARLAKVEVLHRSPLQLFAVRRHLGEDQALRVFPNFAPVLRTALLAVANRESPLGIRARRRRGSGQSFHQLREYRDGDLLQHVDWKATSRRRQLISREFREDQSQELVFLLDGGRRMRALDGDLPHFDHCLNTILLLAYLALRQGDAVGVVPFGGTGRVLPPQKRAAGLRQVLETLYDHHPSTEPSDFEEAARQLLLHQQRRAMVVLLTSLRGEDHQDVLNAVRTLQRRHLVVVVSLREREVDGLLLPPQDGLSAALDCVAAHQYVHERRRVLEDIASHGVRTLDVVVDELPVALANAYLDAKYSGAL